MQSKDSHRKAEFCSLFIFKATVHVAHAVWTSRDLVSQVYRRVRGSMPDLRGDCELYTGHGVRSQSVRLTKEVHPRLGEQGQKPSIAT